MGDRPYRWQKIRILFDEDFPHLESLLAWGRIGPPQMEYMYDRRGQFVGMAPGIRTNLAPQNKGGICCVFTPEQVEWQGGRHNFAHEVGIVSRRTWTNPAWGGVGASILLTRDDPEEYRPPDDKILLISLHGRTHSVPEWSRLLSISKKTIYARHNRGLSPEKILSTKRLPYRMSIGQI
jgi:hypothetical protein